MAAFLLLSQPLRIAASPEVTQKAQKFVAAHESRFRPLEIEGAMAWWEANITGKDEDYERKTQIQNRVDAALSDPRTFQDVKQLKEQAKEIDDPIARRCVELLYLMYLEKQVDPELLKKIAAKANDVEKAFNNYRAKVDGKELTDSEVRKVLKESRDSERRRLVWEASKGVGAVLEKDLRELVLLRNEAARKLGFKNYHALQLHLNEQDGAELIALFDELDALTRKPFEQAKADMDAVLAKNCGVTVAELMPWHYHDPFFQETPAVFPADLDQPYKKADLPKMVETFYSGIGLPVDKVLERSDLYEKKGKSPHAFCTDITRDGTNVRVLANIVNNAYWASTLLHEFGHSVYTSRNIPEKLPYTLRMESHILTTEGVAMMFERMAKRKAFLEKMGLKVEDAAAFEDAGAKSIRYQLLIFSRWCQVMLRFEKSMYENPEQDLNKLWWDLVEKYQLQHRPAKRNSPDYAAKIHIVSAPVYYHNYMMGELFASQLHHAIARDVYKGAEPAKVVYVGNKEVGKFMKKRVFEPGRTLPWNELTRHATGEPLNPKAFAEDFKGK
jgi:peptidyl-dipeptidase A